MTKELIRKELFFNKLPFWIFAALLFLLPFQAFLQVWLRFKLGLPLEQVFYLSLWKEFLVATLILLAGLKIALEKKVPFKILTLDKLIFGFFLLALLYFFAFGGGLEQKITGLRYDLEFFGIYFLARIFQFSKYQIKAFLGIFLGTAAVAVVFGLLQVSLIPPDFLVKLGYSGSFEEYLKTGIIPTYEPLSSALSNLYRIQSTFPGDLQFSSYLILVVTFLGAIVLFSKTKTKIYLAIPLLASAIALAATFTRSAWIGFVFAGFAILLIFVKRKIYIILPAIALIVLSFASFKMLLENKTFETLILHGEVRGGELFGSTEGHKSAFGEAVNIIVQNPLGKGVGTAGPASKVGEKVVIPESWYLQILIEFGVLGLILFVGIIISLGKKLYLIYQKAKDPLPKMLALGLLGALIGLSVQNLFLHTWADTATAYPFWLFAGLLVALFGKER